MDKKADAYKAAGVDIHAGNEFVRQIKDTVKSTFTKGVITDIGGFGGLFRLDTQNMKNPVLVSGTDGVGTKLKLAFEFDCHDTIGIDLVAMSVNDVLVQGAVPLFFLDYFATSKLDQDKALAVLKGIADGCKESNCALLGGETAEMPGFYADGEYDLSGFCVGAVDYDSIIDGSNVKANQKIIGLASSGVHSNGYSLVRKILAESSLTQKDIFPNDTRTVQDVLLAPTKLYVAEVLDILKKFTVHAMAHITGGGFYDNIPRVLPDNVVAKIQYGSWDSQTIFDWLAKEGKLTAPEMLQIFNCGIGFMLVVDADDSKNILARLAELKVKAWEIGEIIPRKDKEEQVEIVFPS